MTTKGSKKPNVKKHNQPEKIPESVLFVPHTPGGALKKRLQAIEDAGLVSKVSGVVRVVERGGDTLYSQLGNPAPWTKEHCGREICPPCDSKPGSCKRLNVTYRITCTDCKENGKRRHYIGETHRSFWDRAMDHYDALNEKNESYGVVKHWMEEHPVPLCSDKVPQNKPGKANI